MSGGRLPKRIVFGNLEDAGDWKATALKAQDWVERVTEGGRKFMSPLWKEEVDAARHRHEKREGTRLGKLLSHAEATSRRNPRTDARRTETCVAPVDASRDFYLCPPNKQRGE